MVSYGPTGDSRAILESTAPGATASALRWRKGVRAKAVDGRWPHANGAEGLDDGLSQARVRSSRQSPVQRTILTEPPGERLRTGAFQELVHVPLLTAMGHPVVIHDHFPCKEEAKDKNA